MSQVEKTSEPSRISVSVAGDRLTASVTVRAGAPAKAEELGVALEVARVLAGIDPGALELLTLGLGEETFEITGEVIARGAAPLDGEDALFEPAFREGIQPGLLREDGTLDFHDRDLLKPVQKGELVGLIRAARPGTAGYLVDGTPLPARAVKEVALVLGAGVERDPEGVVRAARSGVVVYAASQSLDVLDQHVHPGPVDLHSGHLHMEGSLIVNGDVSRSFNVFASGDVEIRGGVENGSVQAGGNVRVRRGVRGGDGSLVCAAGDLSVHHAESATLYAGRLLQVGECVHSRIAAGRVEVSGKLRGGLTQAEFSVVVRELGSPQGTETEVNLAEPLELPLERAQRALERAKALRVIGLANRDSADGSKGRMKGGKLGRAKTSLERVEGQNLVERVRRREALSRLAFLQVGVAYPGVVLRIGPKKLLIEQETRASRFSLDRETRELRADKIGS